MYISPRMRRGDRILAIPNTKVMEHWRGADVD